MSARWVAWSITFLLAMSMIAVAYADDTTAAKPKKNQQWLVVTMRFPQQVGDATQYATVLCGISSVTEHVQYEGKPAIRRIEHARLRVTFAGESRLNEGTDTFYHDLDGRLLAKTSSATTMGMTKTKETKYGPDSVTYKTTTLKGEVIEGTVKIPKGRSVVRSVDVPLCDVPLRVGAVYDGVSFDDETHEFYRVEYRVESEEEITTPSGTEKVFVVTHRCDNGAEYRHWLRADHTTVKYEGIDYRGIESKGVAVSKEEAEKHLKGE